MGYFPNTRGENSRAAKLTEEKVREILRQKGTAKASELARHYGVTVTAINRIWRRQSWSHVQI